MDHIKINSLKQILMFMVLMTLIVFASFSIRLIRIQIEITDFSTTLYANSPHQTDLLLEDFPVYEQTYANSCGNTTISMVYSYLVEPITEQELADELGFPLEKSGMLPAQFFSRLQSALEKSGYHVDQQVNITDTAFLERVHLQLKQGVPVPIYFSTINAWDKPDYDTHYSVVIGIHPQKQEVVIANAYGFLEEIPISDLLDAVKYKNYRNLPFDFRLGLLFGLINRNNLYVIGR